MALMKSHIRRALAARDFANQAHEAVGQKRKHTGEPYIVHPAEVADIVASVPHSIEMTEAAFLHDVVEDTTVTLAEIHERFGPLVAEYVGWVTDVARPEDGNRAVRKAINRDHLASAPAAAQSIKVADIISNVSTILRQDPAFAKVYVPEKAAALEVLTRADPVLLSRARKLVSATLEQLRPRSGPVPAPVVQEYKRHGRMTA